MGRASTPDVSGARPLRVVHVSFFADPERRDARTLLDAWHALPSVASAVSRAGVRVAVVQAAHEPDTVERDGVLFHFVEHHSRSGAGIAGRISRRRRPTGIIEHVASLAPDVVHVQGLVTPTAAGFLARAMRGVAVVAQDHASSPPGPREIARRIEWKWSYRPLSGVIFTAREQAVEFFEAGVFRDELRVFEVVGTSSTFRPGDRDAARRASGIHGDPCLLWTTHLNANKDPLTALAAFEVAAARLPDARLWICFVHAPMLDEVRRRIAESEVLRDRVTLLGTRSHREVEELFRSADLFVQTSHREASGRSVLDALACGVTPLVTDIPSFRRIVGSVGSVTPVGNAPALAEKMVAWARRDRVERRRAARDWFDRALSFDAIGRDLRAVYENVASRS